MRVTVEVRDVVPIVPLVGSEAIDVVIDKDDRRKLANIPLLDDCEEVFVVAPWMRSVFGKRISAVDCLDQRRSPLGLDGLMMRVEDVADALCVLFCTGSEEDDVEIVTDILEELL